MPSLEFSPNQSYTLFDSANMGNRLCSSTKLVPAGNGMTKKISKSFNIGLVNDNLIQSCYREVLDSAQLNR